MTWSPLWNSEGNIEVTRTKLVFKVIIWKYFRAIVPIVWSEVRSRKYRPLKDSQRKHPEEKKDLPVSGLVTFCNWPDIPARNLWCTTWRGYTQVLEAKFHLFLQS